MALSLRSRMLDLGGLPQWLTMLGLGLTAGAGGWLLSRSIARARVKSPARDIGLSLRAILDGTSDAIYAKDLNGRYQYMNPAGLAALGVATEAEVLGKDDTALLDPASAAAEMARDQAVIASGVTTTLDEVATARATGETRLWHTTKGIVRNRQGAAVGLFGISRDITERQLLEQRVYKGERLEAVGRLAGGVAHDFNNILVAIMGYAELMQEDLAPTDPHRADLKEILTAAIRARDLTRQLLAFSRRQVLDIRVLDLNDVVRSVQGMMGRLIGEDIEVELALAPDLACVRADAGQFEQVLVNLAVNARDAMPEGGKLTIETRNVELNESYARAHESVMPGAYVLLAVSDSGFGMDQGTRLHLFEPFFTTKEKEKGTGLGLATVYGVVKQSGGYIWVYSEPNLGATFKIYLPRVEDTAALVAAPANPPAGGSAGTETVLVVEDDDAVRNLAATMLRRRGYRVLTAARPLEALELLDTLEEPVHLLLSDIVMPELSGPALAKEVAARIPGIRVLFQSGYSELVINRRGLFETDSSFLQKPYTADALLRKVRELLDGSPSS